MSIDPIATPSPGSASPLPAASATNGSPAPLTPPMPGMLIREWHTMSPIEQRMEWTGLLNWVIWLHDQYELSKEERLPLCWTRHPGLIEELRSLKAWREATYDTPDTRSAAHTARSWHGELRQTIAAATTFWARGCRAGHRDAPPLAEAEPDLADQWRQSSPPLMPTSLPLRTQISHEDMTTLLRDGTAERHSPVLGRAVTFAGTWWRQEADRQPWLRVGDAAHHATLDNALARMNMADTAASTVNRP